MHGGKQFRLPDVAGTDKSFNRNSLTRANVSAKQSKAPPLPKREGPPAIPRKVPITQPPRSADQPRDLPSRLGNVTKSYVGSTVIKNAVTPEDPPYKKPVLLKLEGSELGPEILQSSTLARLITTRQLPITVTLSERNSCVGCSVVLERGSALQIHYLYKTERIYATDKDGTGYYLPLYALQLYTVLPIDPIHDDKLYPTTLDLINARPLPRRVRIEEAHFSDHPGEAQECGDIIEIEKIEKRPVPFDSDNSPEKCLIGTCNGVPIAFSQSMDCASYSTMPSIDFMSLSEIVKKFPLPLRVRKADNPAFVLMLHRWDEEYHVVATSANLNQVLSIPATWDGKIEILENEPLEKLLQNLLPPLYPLVNTTWGLREPGRLDLPSNMQLVAQPLLEILESWSRTKEGQEFVFKASKTNVDYMKMRIEELMDEKTRLNNELRIYRTDAPAPPPRTDMATPRPAVPPRLSTASLYPTSPTSPSFAGDSGDYEQPMPVMNKGKSHVKSSKELEEMKSLLQAKETENNRLQVKIKRIESENRDLDGRNASLVEKIRSLQQKIDKLEADPMYDTLAEGVGYHNPNAGPVYGERSTLPGNRLTGYDEKGVCNLLREMKLEAYVGKFKENCINGELLATLDEEDLYGEIGMGRIHAKRLMLEVKKRLK